MSQCFAVSAELLCPQDAMCSCVQAAKKTAGDGKALVGVASGIMFATIVAVAVLAPRGLVVPSRPRHLIDTVALWAFDLDQLGILETVPAMLRLGFEQMFCFGTGVIIKRLIVDARVDHCPGKTCSPRIHLT